MTVIESKLSMGIFIKENLFGRFRIAGRMIRSAFILALCGEVLMVFDGPIEKHCKDATGGNLSDLARHGISHDGHYQTTV